MKKRMKLIILSLALLLTGCGQESQELTKEEQEEIYREEVQKRLEEEQQPEKTSAQSDTDEEREETKELEETEIFTEKTSDVVENSNIERFEALPTDTQIALLTPYYDERGQPQGITEGAWSIMYGLEDNLIFLQVHSGAGTGHPIYLIERQGDTFLPVDGVVAMGIDGYEVSPPPQVNVTVDQLLADYESAPDLYDGSAGNTGYYEELNSVSFDEMKTMTLETSDSSESMHPEEPPVLIPNQPMFINGMLYSGDVQSASPEEIDSLEDLRAQGYEVYPLTYEEYHQLLEDIPAYNLTSEDMYEFFLYNYAN